jgi:hypothetical protein
MGNLIIPGHLLEQAKISPNELRVEIAPYLDIQGELDVSDARHC